MSKTGAARRLVAAGHRVPCSRGARVCAVSSLCCGCPVAFCAALRLVASIALLASSSGAAIAARCPSAAPPSPRLPPRGEWSHRSPRSGRPTLLVIWLQLPVGASVWGFDGRPCCSQSSMRFRETCKGLAGARNVPEASVSITMRAGLDVAFLSTAIRLGIREGTHFECSYAVQKR